MVHSPIFDVLGVRTQGLFKKSYWLTIRKDQNLYYWYSTYFTFNKESTVVPHITKSIVNNWLSIQHSTQKESIRQHPFISFQLARSIHDGKAFTVVIKALEYSTGKSSISSLVKAPSSKNAPLCVIWAANIDIFLIVKVSSPLRTCAEEWGFEWRVLMPANGRAYTACHLDLGDTRWCYVIKQQRANSMRTCCVHHRVEQKCTVIGRQQKI